MQGRLSNSPLQPASAATALAAERLIRWTGEMRAAERLQGFESQDARHGWLRAVRDVAAWSLLVVHFLLGVLLVDLLFCTDPSDVDDSMIGPVLGLMILVGFGLLGFVIGGARPLPTASATIPPLVLLSLPWRDIHYAAIPTTCWLAAHVGVLVWCIVRRPTPRRSRRAATSAPANPNPSHAARGSA